VGEQAANLPIFGQISFGEMPRTRRGFRDSAKCGFVNSSLRFIVYSEALLLRAYFGPFEWNLDRIPEVEDSKHEKTAPHCLYRAHRRWRFPSI
jgi:hypothetical protein